MKRNSVCSDEHFKSKKREQEGEGNIQKLCVKSDE